MAILLIAYNAVMKKSFFPISVKILFTNPAKNKALLAYYGDAGYGLVGGHINQGEKIIDAAIREAYEETGLTIEPGSLRQYGFTEHHSGKIVLIYSCAIDDSLSPVAQDDVQDLVWASVDDIKAGKYKLGEYLNPIIDFTNSQ